MGTHPIFESDFDCLTEVKMAKGGKGQKAFTADEEKLLANFSRKTSGKGTLVFWIHALYVVAIPIWIQARIHQYAVSDNLIYLIIGTIAQAAALKYAYTNVKFVSKEKIATLRSEAIANEVTQKIAKSEGKNVSRQELDDRILHRKNEVADNESLHYSIFYNNTIYLVMYLLFSIMFFKNSTPLMNYMVSIVMASGFVAGISNTKYTDDYNLTFSSITYNTYTYTGACMTHIE